MPLRERVSATSIRVAQMSLGDPLPGRDLAAFVTAVESGSIQGAADALALTQSAATKRLQALERRVGRALLERRADGVRPTVAGKQLYPLAREALAALERAESALAAPESVPLLRIHASRTIGEALLPGWLASFRANSPPCRVFVDITNSEEVAQAVREGDAELGFVEGPAGNMHGLRELVLAHDEIRLVVAAQHPWANRARGVSVTELRAEPFLAREAGSGTRAVVTAAFSEVGIDLQPAFEASSTESLKRGVLDGGFAFLSERVIAAELASGALAVVGLSGLDLRRSLRAVRRSRPALQGPARAFWRSLERGAGASPPAASHRA